MKSSLFYKISNLLTYFSVLQMNIFGNLSYVIISEPVFVESLRLGNYKSTL